MSDYMVDETSGRATVRYGHVAAFFHWLTLLLVLVQLYLGFTFADLPKGSPERMQTFAWHKTVGATILIVVLLRLANRLINPPPPYPSDMPKWDRTLAVWSHRLFYVLLVALPLTGLIAASRPGSAWVELVGGLRLPAIPIGPGFGDTHEVLVFVTIGLVVLHVAAGVWHQWIRKDHAAGRMPPLPVSHASE